MTIEQLRLIHRTTPFRPFTIHLADGRRIPVAHREFLSHSRRGRTIIVFREDDSFDILSLDFVTEMRTSESFDTSSGEREV